MIVARPPGELERELADQLVQMREIGDDALVLDRVADVRDEQDPDILQVVAVTTAVHVDEVHAVLFGVVDDVVGVEVAVQPDRHRRRQRGFEVRGPLEQVVERAVRDPEHPALAAAQRLELRVEREELRQPLPDLSGVVDPRRLLHERGRPDIADGLEQTPGHADLLLPAARDEFRQPASPFRAGRQPGHQALGHDLKGLAGHDRLPTLMVTNRGSVCTGDCFGRCAASQ